MKLSELTKDLVKKKYSGENYQEILKYVPVSDYIKGRNYWTTYLEHIDKKVIDNIIKNKFHVESERTSRIYVCNIESDKTTGDISSMNCDCPQFKETKSCKHLAACMYNFYDEIFVFDNDSFNEQITSKIFDIFNKIDKEKETRFVKEEVKFEIELIGNNNNSRYVDYLDLNIKIGTDKLYSCKKNKLSKFLEAYKNKEIFEFGKNFTYDPNRNYFSKENTIIINYLVSLNDRSNNYYSSSELLVGQDIVKYFLNLIKDYKYKLNGFHIKKSVNGFPLESNLSKKDNNYSLSFNINDGLFLITNDLEYVQVDSILYNLNAKEQVLLFSILVNEINEFSIDKNNKDMFKNSLLPVVKNKIEISSDIDDIKISKEVKVKLYFDLYYDKVICNLTLVYDDKEINYFDNSSDVIRDSEYERKIIDELYSYHFKIENNKILLDDINDIGVFLDDYLIELTEKYETYTSEKLKRIKIVKKNNIRSTFSIGQDNIMSYSFDLGNIKEDEIVNVLESLRSKKKYYRLKSGDILDLESDESLEELDRLQQDMNISKKDLENGSGVIPKYRAIYLDSIKDNNYHIIETNNLFDELISNFRKYKDSKISLNKKDEILLREYQKDGVKWLYNIDKTGFGGVLADEMGLGKSIQTIYYIKELLKEDESYKFLIVAPTSLAYNWQAEFDKFGSELKYIPVIGMKTKRHEYFDKLDDYNIFITTYGLLREDKEFYDKINFKTMVIDEAQNIKNPNTGVTKTVKSIKANTRIALTGTPIENSVNELWSIFDFIMPGFLADLDSFDKKYKIKDFDEDANLKLTSLNKLISPFILRRRKKDVIKDLPDKIENNIFVEMTKEQKKVYLAELERVNKEIEEAMATGGIQKVRFLILGLLTKLRQICIDPRIVFDKYIGGSEKMNEFVNIVKDKVENGHKILVFTSFRTALELARKELSNNDITSYTIDGSVSSKKRMELVDKFNNDKTNVFFIMLKAGGTGLNLTSADVVIHLDLWWNPQAENQATDRAHRIGQKNVVEVIKIVSTGTIEEKILDLQKKKKLLSDKVIDENMDEKAFSKLTEKDIKELLSYENSD